MKRILKYIVSVFIISLAFPTLDAKQISPETASRNVAAYTTKLNGKKRKGVAAHNPSAPLSLVETVKDPKSTPLYYIFSKGIDRGFIIASADDRLVPILCNTDKGTFESVEKLPQTMQDWLKNYDMTISSLLAGGNDSESIAIIKQRDEIDPLLEVWWGQDYPLNKKCPVVDGERAPVGCVATAMSMIMYYHQYPEQGQGTLLYTNPTDKQTISYDFGNTHFDFSKMQPYYDGYEEDDEIDAAAELCFAAGVSVQSEYRSTGTGADLAATPFNNYFNYPSEGLALLSRSYFTPEEWDDLVYDELQNGRPVLYRGGGKVGSGGHAFVIDGYEEETGLFHINWGWYGDADGYYNLSILRPDSSGTGSNGDDVYSIDQQIVRGLHTPEGAVPTPIFTADGVSFNEDTQSYNIDKFYCRGGQNQIYAGLEAENIETGEKIIVKNSDNQLFTIRDNSGAGINRLSISFNPDFSVLTDGEYRLRPMAKLTEDEQINPGNYTEYYPIYCTLVNTRYITVTIKDGKVVGSKNGSDVNHDIEFTNFRSATTLISGSNLSFTMDAVNKGNTIIQSVRVWVYEHGSDELAWTAGERSSLVLEPGNSGTFNLAIPNITNKGGVFDLQVKNNEDSTINYSARIPFHLANSGNGVTKDGFKYVIISEEEATAAVIRSNTTVKGEVVFPETVEINGKDYTLVELSNALLLSSTGVTKVTLPSTIKRIAGSAFSGCSALESINLPESVEFIGGSCFMNCKALTSLVLPKNLTSIGDKTFSSAGLTSVELPEGLISIGQYAFYGCKLTRLILPSTVENIGSYAFNNDNVSTIICKAPTPPAADDYSFYSLSYRNATLFVPAESIELYKSAPGWKNFTNYYQINEDRYAKVGDLWYELTDDFEAYVIAARDGNEYSLTKITVPDNITYVGMTYKVTEISDGAFAGHSELTTFSGGGSLRRIGSHAFENSGLTSVALADGLVEIGDFAFHNTNLSSISSFPAELKRIGESAFEGNKNFYFYKKMNLPNNWLSFPSTLESIGDRAFFGCESIDKFQINGEIEYGEEIFSGCSSLKMIHLANENVPLKDVNTLSNLAEKADFYINKEDRSYFVEGLDDISRLKDLLSIVSIEWEGKPDMAGMTEVTIQFDSKLGNPTTSTFIVKNALFKDIASVKTNGYDEYAEKGLIRLTFAPYMIDKGTAQVTFEQPGFSRMFEINVTEVANLIQTITLSDEDKTLNLGDTFNLEASYSPVRVDDSELVWSSSNTSVATVDNYGKVTAVGAGNAAITCKALLGTASAKCTVEVKSVLRPGKALDEDDPNADVTVADVVAIVNHITGNTPANFNMQNADVNQDGNITVSDVTSTVKIILNTEKEEGAETMNVRRLDEAVEGKLAILHFDEIAFSNTGATVRAALETYREITALQTDISVPENVVVSDIALCEETTGHILSWKKLNNGNYRVIVYSLSNAPLLTDEPVFNLEMQAVGQPVGAIDVSNSWISTPDSQKFGFVSTGGAIGETLGIGSITNFPEETVDVYSAGGILVKRDAKVRNLPDDLTPGIYILRGKTNVTNLLIK